jgi:hypothetical protein
VKNNQSGESCDEDESYHALRTLGKNLTGKRFMKFSAVSQK